MKDDDWDNVINVNFLLGNDNNIKYICTLCGKLKELEDTWIMRLGTFFHLGGLNKRDEIKRKVRASY